MGVEEKVDLRGRGHQKRTDIGGELGNEGDEGKSIFLACFIGSHGARAQGSDTARVGVYKVQPRCLARQVHLPYIDYADM